MTLEKPFKRTKFCFVYCGPERCDCGATYIPYEQAEVPTTGGIEEKKTEKKMTTLDLTDKEVNALYQLVVRQRGRNNLLKQLHDIDVEEHFDELISLREKLIVIKVDE